MEVSGIMKKIDSFRWGVCMSTVIFVLALMGFIVVVVYFLFFRVPFIGISQGQVFRLPLDSRVNESFTGIQLVFDAWNPNIVNFEILSIYVIPTVVSTKRGNPRFDLKPVRDINSTNIIKGRAMTTFVARSLLYVGDNERFRELQQ